MGKILAIAPISMQGQNNRVGEIRIGESKDAAKRAGHPYPKGIDTFRFTSLSRNYLEAVAKRYGGEVQPWNDADHPGWWELVTPANELQVVIDRHRSLDVEYNQFTRAGKSHECDGQTCKVVRGDSIVETPCTCDPAKRACKLKSTLYVIMPDVVLGLWRIVTGSEIFFGIVSNFFELLDDMGVTGRVPCLLLVRRGDKRVPGKPPEKYSYPDLVFDPDPPNMTALLYSAQQKLLGRPVQQLPQPASLQIEAPKYDTSDLPVEPPDQIEDIENAVLRWPVEYVQCGNCGQTMATITFGNGQRIAYDFIGMRHRVKKGSPCVEKIGWHNEDRK